MSDELPDKKTSTVPLKKETVRITLRSQSDDSGPVAPKGTTDPIKPKGGTEPLPSTPAPPAPSAMSTPPPPPGASTPPPPPGASTPPPPPGVDPSGPTKAVDVDTRVDPLGPTKAVDLDAKVDPLGPTVPVSTAPDTGPPSGVLTGPPSGPIGAKTIPLGPAPAAAVGAIGAKTIPLGQVPPPASGNATIPLSGGPTPLPQATVKMAGPQTGVLPAPQQASVRAGDDEDEWDEANPDSGMLVFGIIGLLLGLAVLAIQLITFTSQS